MGDAVTERTWRPGRPVDVRATLGSLRRGASDPTYRSVEGDVWRTVLTPDGPGTQRLRQVADDAVESGAWGPGAEWLTEMLPELLGAGDDEAGEFRPRHPLLREAQRRHLGWRVPRSNRVVEALLPAVLEQKVTGKEARASWRRLVSSYGTEAPGPAPSGLRVVPPASVWARIPSWEWHRAGVGPERSRTAVTATGRAAALERTLDATEAEADRGLRSLPGIGPWTSAEVRQRAHGHADAVSVGDFHLASQVVYALTGEERGDDERMLELLEPYAGHRYRAIRMVELSGVTAPRRGPRYTPLDHRTR